MTYLDRRAWEHYYQDPVRPLTEGERAVLVARVLDALPGYPTDKLTALPDHKLAEMWVDFVVQPPAPGAPGPIGDDDEAKYRLPA